jgi:uncharacterized protein YgiM (DUF1202 family)
MNTINRRQFLLATAGAAVFAFSPSRRAGATVDIYQVVDGPLNLRSAPGLSASIVAVLPLGTKMEIIDVGGPKDGYYWVEVWVSSLDKTGFVADQFIARVPDVVAPTWAVGATPVTTTALNLRSGAGLTYPVIVVLWKGAPLTVTGAPVAAGGYTWYPVKTGYGTTGWVAGEFLGAGSAPAPTYPVGSTVYTTAALNLRGGAGLVHPVIVVLWAGAPLTVTGAPVAADGYSWYPVKTSYGTTGWVAGTYLRT